VRTTNPKIHERLIRPFGGELFMVAVGWKREGECLVLPPSVAADAMTSAVAQLHTTAEERKKARDAAEREKLRAERQAALKAKQEEKERVRKAMEADRREVSARGPAETIHAQALPSGPSGTHRLNLEPDPEDNRQPHND